MRIVDGKKMAKIEEIIIGHQPRKDLGDIESLQFSMVRFNQLQPILVESCGDKYKLIFGERRLVAAKNLGWTEVWVEFRENLDDATRWEIQLEENIRRKALSWVEEVQGFNELHRIKQEQYGKATPGKFSQGWGMRETAEALDASVGAVAQNLELAEALEKHPSLKEEVTKRAAFRRLRRIEAGLDLPEPDKYRIILKESYYVDEAESAVKQIPAGSVSLMLVDIADQPVGCVQRLFKLLKPTGHGYIFFEMKQYTMLLSELAIAKVQYIVDPYIWHIRGEDDYIPFVWFSPNLTHPPAAIRKYYGFRRNEGFLHKREKPTELYFNLITNSSERSEFVFEPYAYTGIGVKISMQTGRRVVGLCNIAAIYNDSIERLVKER